MIDDAIAKLDICDVKFRQIEIETALKGQSHRKSVPTKIMGG